MSIWFSSGDVVSTFVDGFGHLQRLMGPVEDETRDGVRLLRFANGRRGTPYLVELFPHDVPPEPAIRVAMEAAGEHPHLISALGEETVEQVAEYVAAGYEHWGHETLMLRDLSDLPPPAETPVRHVEDLNEGVRIVAAETAAGLRAHPIAAAHLDDPAVFNRWIELDGEPAAFGRQVVLGERVYLSDVVTLPAFRRRGLGNALVLRLLHDARDVGARWCVLTSSEMGRSLYQALGFVDVMPLTGFQRGSLIG